MITAEVPVAPAAPRSPRLARRAWVEHVMGMPVSVHVRAVEPTIACTVASVFSKLCASRSKKSSPTVFTT